MRKAVNLFLVVAFISFLASCGGSKADLLVGNWTLDAVEIENIDELVKAQSEEGLKMIEEQLATIETQIADAVVSDTDPGIGAGSLVWLTDDPASGGEGRRHVGCGPERSARVCQGQAPFHGPEDGRLDRVGRGELVLHAQPLSGGQFLAGHAGAANARRDDQRDSRSRACAGQDWPRRIGLGSGAGRYG